MPMLLSRRRLLATATAAAALAGLSPLPSGAAPGSSAASPTPARLTVGRRTIDVLGRPASVFGIRQPDGTHGLALDPGQRFLVDLENRSGEDTIIHWHGMTPPHAQDGVVGAGQPLIADGATRRYDFDARPGTHWMHSHHGLQEQALMAAPLVVRTVEDLRSDAQEVTVILHDFTFRDPADVLAGLTGGTMVHAHGGHHGHGAHGGHGTPMDLNDVDYDAYLANDRTLEDPQVVRAERGGLVRLRLINGATSTAFHIDLGRLTGTVVAVDGNPVEPVNGSRFGMTMGQRLDILLRLPADGGSFPVLAQREGDRKRTGLILATAGAAVSKVDSLAGTVAGPVDLSLEERLAAVRPLEARPADAAFTIMLTGAMAPYVWSIDDRVHGEHEPIRVRCGQRVHIEMVNGSDMAHPMHLHGHHFQVIGLNGVPLGGAVRDTVLVPVNGTVTVAFDADNPGRWPLHCHNLLHMATGMMTEVVCDPVV